MLRHFKVATFNLYNLVLPNHSFYDDRHYTPEQYAQKQDWIVHQLEQMRADIVGFQEVFHEAALRQTIAQSSLYDRAHILVANPSGDQPVVGLLSRFPILEHEVIESFPPAADLHMTSPDLQLNHFSRPILVARIALTPTIDFTVIVVHLKSKRPIIPEGADRFDPVERVKGQVRSLLVRAAEATALRAILVDRLQGGTHPVILMGDMNDSEAAVTSQIVSGQPPDQDMDFAVKQKLWDVLLYNVKDLQARQSYSDFYYTLIHNGHYQSLDHIMVSQEFVVQNPKRIGRVKYVSVFNDHLIDETLSDEEIPVWRSDHGQVVVGIELRGDGVMG